MTSILIRNCKRSTSSRSLVLTIYASWKTLNDPDSTPPKTEKGLRELFREIRATVGEEAQIVQVVFPNPPLVMQVFLQRVFSQTVSF